MDATEEPYYDMCGYVVKRTELQEAAYEGRAQELRQLIESGASVNVTTVDDITPLHDACQFENLECVRLLLEAGAQVDARTKRGTTPLCDACASGSLECVKLLLEYGAEVNPSLTALTASPLHEACMQGNVEVVRLMIESGAQLEAFNVRRGPPLYSACARKHVDCVRELLCAGANVNSAKFHKTPLHRAARLNMERLVELLVEFGANVHASDKLGKKPVDYAAPGSPSYTRLRFYESNPLTLQQLSRIAMRKMLGTRASKAIDQLNIPCRIQSYLQYRDHQSN